ncbi:membrane protein [Candidatus Bathyarchaeota archaeon]|nr:membrane protein [Candidatus Bathyarchaeota archaeon]
MDDRLNWVSLIKKMPSLIAGLFLCAVAVVSNLNSGLGMHPWGVFHLGIAIKTGLSFGTVTQLVGFVVILIGWSLGFAPGVGTVLNMILVGWFMDIIIQYHLLPTPSDFIGSIAMVVFSVIITGLATWLYLRVQLGAGPRDGLMVGFVRKMNKPVWLVRGITEVTVLLVGWSLGGAVGIGTVIVALSVGYSIQLFFKIGKFDGKSKQKNLYEQYKELFLENK